jgi:hypothetical protein
LKLIILSEYPLHVLGGRRTELRELQQTPARRSTKKVARGREEDGGEKKKKKNKNKNKYE